MRLKTACAAVVLVMCTLLPVTQAQSVHAPVVQGQTLEGALELRWGDGAPGTGSADRFTVSLVTDDGVRHPLDPEQARRASDNLYALANRRVAMVFEPATAASLRAGPGASAKIGAIVAADRFKLGEPTDNAISGTTPWITIMCKFSDVAAEPQPLSFFQSQYGNGVGQLDQYWREVSYNKVNLTGSQAYGWFTLPQPRSFYVAADNSKVNLDQLFDDCTSAADGTVNFATVAGGVQGINMMFNDALDCCAWGGGRNALLDGVRKTWSATWNPPFAYRDIAPLTHEMGHGYGLPHANNSDNDSSPYDNPWDVMSDAYNNATSNSTYGRVAKHINTYHRNQLGWIDAARKLTVQAGGTTTGIPLDRASLIGSANTQMIVVRVPGQPTSKYYTVEARKRVGYYEGNLAGDAVIIHAVDTSRSEPSWSVDADTPPANTSNNEGSMFKPGETWSAPDSAFRVRVLDATAQGFRVSICGAPLVLPRRGKAAPRVVDPCDQLATTIPPRRVPPVLPPPPTNPKKPPCPRGGCFPVVSTAIGQ